MSRFFLSREAEADLDEIIAGADYYGSKSAAKTLRTIGFTLQTISRYPYRGRVEGQISSHFAQETRRMLAMAYRIYYFVGSTSEIIAILHTSRNHPEILLNRVS